jgi:dTDP-4-amino-4,6-dideoxygalactose transaminase
MVTKSKTDSLIPLYNVSLPPDIVNIIKDVLATKRIANGSNVAKFEKLLSNYLGNPFVTTTGDISSSLTICLYLAGVRPGDDVLMSPLVCLSTSCPVRNLFANIRWCDVNSATGNLDPDSIPRMITSRTKAIVVYHWVGNPADLEAIYTVAHAHNLAVIEDAGEAFGAEYHGRKIGATGSDYTLFSFYPNRHLTTIEGGAISFARKDDYEKARWLKRYGIHQPDFRDREGEINPASDIPVAGWNSYMNEVASAIGVAQMERFPEILARHRENGLYYDQALANIPGVTVLQRLADSASAYWVYTFLVHQRDSLLARLRQEGVYASKVHLRNDLYAAFGGVLENLPGVSEFSAHCLSVPCGGWVSDENRKRIIDLIRKKYL